METLLDRINILKVQGYDNQFVFKNGKLYHDNKKLDTHYLQIDETFRIEGDSNPNEEVIVYAITCKQPHLKGILIDSFGMYAEIDKEKFIEKIS